eukprot:1141095-Pelagomonas_calceolata.AAC.1
MHAREQWRDLHVSMHSSMFHCTLVPEWVNALQPLNECKQSSVYSHASQAKKENPHRQRQLSLCQTKERRHIGSERAAMSEQGGEQQQQCPTPRPRGDFQLSSGSGSTEGGGGSDDL